MLDEISVKLKEIRDVEVICVCGEGKDAPV